jgi:hypothetical protein
LQAALVFLASRLGSSAGHFVCQERMVLCGLQHFVGCTRVCIFGGRAGFSLTYLGKSFLEHFKYLKRLAIFHKFDT